MLMPPDPPDNLVCLEVAAPATDSLKRNWRAYWTFAPREYDGFGTLTVFDRGDEGRLVLVECDHLDWQLTRYDSGMCAYHEADQNQIRGAMRAILERIMEGEDGD